MHQPERPDPLDHDARRRAAEAAAQAAEARAAVAAAEAKAAIAAAARAAAAADAAAAAAEEAVARVTAEFGGRSPDTGPDVASPPTAPVAVDATQPVPVAPRPVAPARPVPPAAVRPAPVPAPRPEPVRRDRPDGVDAPAGDADGARDAAGGPPPAGVEPATTALPAVRPPAGPVGEGRAARRRAAAQAAAGPDPVQDVDGTHPTPARRRTAAEPAGEAQETVAIAAAAGAADATQAVPVRRRRAAEAPDRPADGERQEPAPRRRRVQEEAQDEVQEEAPDEVPTRASRRARGTTASVAPSGGRVIAPRRGLRLPVLVAAAAGGLLVLGAIALGTGVVGAPQPAAVVDTTVPALPGAEPSSAAPAPGAPGTVPASNRAAAFVEQLRAAGVPTSRAGTPEVEAADLVCDQLAGGMDRETLARALPASLATVSRSQAAVFVDVARQHYCG